MINIIDIASRDLTSNAGRFLLPENTKTNGSIELIDTNLVLENESTNKNQMKHIKTMFCGLFTGLE